MDILLGYTHRKAWYTSNDKGRRLTFEYALQARDPDGDIYISEYVPNGAVINLEGTTSTFSLSVPSGTLDIASGVQTDTTPYRQTLSGIDKDVVAVQSKVTNTTLTSQLRSGIGDTTDLQVSVDSDYLGRWIPRIRKGFFYIGEQEYYLFSNKCTTTKTGMVSVDVVDGTPIYTDIKLDVPPESYGYDMTKITDYGPIFVEATIANIQTQLTQVVSVIRAAEELTGSIAITGTNLYMHPVDGVVTEVYRTNLRDTLYEVPDRDSITSSDQFCIETYYYGASGDVSVQIQPYLETEYCSVSGISELIQSYVISVGTDPIYATYIVSDVDQNITKDYLVQYEICVVDSDYGVRAMYRDVLHGDSNFAPKALVIEDGILTSIDITPSGSTNYFVLDDTYTKSDTTAGTITPGDRVALKYYVKNSFTIMDNLSDYNVYIRTLTHTGGEHPYRTGSVSVFYEGSLDDYWDGAEFGSLNPSYVQLNPLKDGTTPGFLYITDVYDRPMPANIYFASATDVVTVSNSTSGSEEVQLLAVVTDTNGNPIQGSPLYLTEEPTYDVIRGSGSTDTVLDVAYPFNIRSVTCEGSSVEASGFSRSYIEHDDSWDVVITVPSGLIPAGKKYKVRIYGNEFVGYFGNTYPAGAVTDWRGQCRINWIPVWPGIAKITCSCDDNPSLSKTIELKQLSFADQCPLSRSSSVEAARIYLTVTEDSTIAGTYKVVAYCSDITGSYPIPNRDIVFHSQKSKFYSAQAVPTNSDGVAINHYYKVNGDYIHASLVDDSIESNLIIVGEISE